ncbi:hypothetical protein O7632_10165 [Solwaraspora sp. WMMD406]|uniref:hypothetical protein n=1 Tax=Solwaraspora sp. WMMD406 TaxID=3016095 RepID=UPI002416BF3A|nr:hypothetical protein [Solwaraspora sp. WMMD406]MDG4764465.1 hypothetical protein [Solwaraspora sp. WMMD406]
MNVDERADSVARTRGLDQDRHAQPYAETLQIVARRIRQMRRQLQVARTAQPTEHDRALRGLYGTARAISMSLNRALDDGVRDYSVDRLEVTVSQYRTTAD